MSVEALLALAADTAVASGALPGLREFNNRLNSESSGEGSLIKLVKWRTFEIQSLLSCSQVIPETLTEVNVLNNWMTPGFLRHHGHHWSVYVVSDSGALMRTDPLNLVQLMGSRLIIVIT